MKIDAPQIRQVESLGRNNIASVGGIASAKGARGDAQSQALNYMAKVGKEFIERKENAEHSASKTNTMIRFNEVEQSLNSKEFFTSKEASALPAGAVRLKNSDGSDRNDIPAYEVVPYLMEEAQRKIIEQESGGISNPMLREDYMGLANGIASKTNLKYAVKAAQDQRTYYKKYDTDASIQLAISGQRVAALKQIEENPDFNELERIQLDRTINETWEWEQDSRILNTENIEAIKRRYDELKNPSYGAGEEEFLQPGKAGGRYNQELDKKRFKSAIGTLTAKRDKAISRDLQEKIDALAKGNDKNNPLTEPEGGFKEYINSLPLSADDKDKYTRLASNAYSQGTARNLIINATFAESEAVQADKWRAFQETDPQYFHETEAAYKGISEAIVYQKKQLFKDANSFLSRHNPAVQAALNRLSKQTVPELQKAAFDNFLVTLRAEQERIGMQPDQINFVSAREIKSFKEETAKFGPMGSFNKITQLDAMEAKYKAEWPAVYNQLIREKALMPEHVLTENIEDPTLKIQYVDALKNYKDLEVKQIYKDNILDARRDVENAIQSLKMTSITQGMLPNTAEGLSVNEQYNALTNGIVQMVMMNVNASGKYSSADAKALVKKIIDDKWVIHNNLRIPINKGYDTDKVVRGLDMMRNNVDVSPDIKFYAVPVEGLSAEDQQAQLREEFSKFNEPQTNFNETGVTYKWANGHPVYVMKGKMFVPLTVTYKEIEQYGTQEKYQSARGMRIRKKQRLILK